MLSPWPHDFLTESARPVGPGLGREQPFSSVSVGTPGTPKTGARQVRIIFIINPRLLCPSPLRVEGSPAVWGKLSQLKAEADPKIRLPHFKSDVKEVCENMK